MTKEQMIAEISRLNAVVAAQPVRQSPFTLKVSDKGAISIYGLGRFPVTLYASQLERLLSKSEDIKAFVLANIGSLASKS